MYGIDDYVFFEATKALPITYLEQRRGKRWYSWMLDDPPHWRAMEIYAEHAKGKVLTAGLGLGLILQAMKGNSNIESITVIEQSPEVVSLVEPHLPSLPEFVILIDDFYNFLQRDRTEFDTIIVDLWVAHGVEEKMEIYRHKVLPLGVELKVRYPKTSITFHGFHTVSDIKHTTPEMVKKVHEIISYLERENN